nr:DEAD/DEAH box helicase family protein [uncultured Rhodopila sp.]
MPPTVIDNPILNSPYLAPARHWVLDEKGIPTGVDADGRRRSEFIVPVPPSKHQTQGDLDLDDEYGQRKPNDYINEIRSKVDAWRRLGDAGLSKTVTPVTARLLKHWRDPARGRRLFFCQIEAVETAIWLAEVAPAAEAVRLRGYNAGSNPDLYRIAFKLATGAGKTTVMAMLIAWQTINAARATNSTRFTDAFLIVAPGITVRDRLRVLLPADTTNTYTLHDIVPRDMRDDLNRARIVITNFHAFKRRETIEMPKLAKEVLGGRDGPVSTLETEGQMLRRVCGTDLLGRSRIVVLNDEAHHCYREKPGVAQKLDAESRVAARKAAEAARLWIGGIEALQRAIGAGRRKGAVQVYDLSATPFFLRGSGYPEGTLFPWVVSDFSLIDAIEAGIVKVPRVPIQDLPGAEEPVYRHVYGYIQKYGDRKLPKAGRGKQTDVLNPDDLPTQLVGALEALYGHYAKKFADWQDKGGVTPPVFIVVCNNTATSELVFKWAGGYSKTETAPDGSELEIIVPGRLPLLSNVIDGGPGQRAFASRPCTILIDSEELESGEALSDTFRKMAAPEIEGFKRELRARGKHKEAETLTDADLLREVMNTVGQVGKLGEQIRCVVSVSMLTEGWDARTVTHVLGVRAFGTQLLCEQVIGRALRRVSYDPIEPERMMFEPEYAEVLGIPFSFVPANSAADYKAPKKTTRVEAVLPEREALEIRFPRVLGYRVVLPPGRLNATFVAGSRMTIDPKMAPPDALNAPFIGENIRLTLDEMKTHREAAIAFHLAGFTLDRWFRDQDGNRKPWLFPSLLAITRRWMAECLTLEGGTNRAYLLWPGVAEQAGEKIYRACVQAEPAETMLRPILDPYNETGSSRYVAFNTTKSNFWTPAPERCQINLIVCDGNWEAACAQQLDDMAEVLRYVKNDHLDFEVPYQHDGQDHRYRPDFIAVLDDGRGPDDPLHLVLEVKGERDGQDDAKHDTMRALWVPSVNAVGRYGRWDFLRVDGPYGLADAVRGHLAGRPVAPAVFQLTSA